MSQKAKISIIAAIIFIVAVLGYFVGINLPKQKQPSIQETQNVTSEKEQPSNQQATQQTHSNVIAYRMGNETKDHKNIKYKELSRTDLKASLPSIGPLMKKVPVRFDQENQRLSLGNQHNEIKKGQRVLFYNEDGSLHLQDATIAFIADNENKTERIAALNLNGPLDIEKLSDKAEVVIMQTSAVARAPLSALLKEENRTYILTAKALDEDKKPTSLEKAAQYLIEKIATKAPLKDDQFFELDYKINTSNLIISNPSSDIESNSIVPFISIRNIVAPTSDPLFEARMQSAVEESALALEEIRAAAAECKAKADAIVPVTPDNDIELSNPGRNCAAESAADGSSACAIAGGTQNAPTGSCGGSGSCGGGSACGGSGSCGGGDSCGGGSACGGAPDPNAPATMIDPYILLGIEKLDPESTQ